MYHPFSIAETTKTAWNIFKKNFVTIIVYSVISFFILSVLAFITTFIFSSANFAETMISTFILIFIQAYTTLGLYKLIFTVIDSEFYEFEFRQVLPAFTMIISYLTIIFLIAFVITNLHFLMVRLDDYPTLQAVIQDMFALVGLYLALRAMFFITFIVDDRSGAFESIRQSFQLTKGYFFKVLTMLCIILVLIALPAILSQTYPVISVTIIFTYPFVNIILAVTYRKLVYSHQDVDDDIAETN